MSWFLLIGVMSLALFSCQQSLEDAVQSMKKDLPKDCGGGMKMTNIENQADYVVLTMTTDEKEMKMDNPLIEPVLKGMSDQLKEQFITADDTRPLFSRCKEENKGFKVILEGEVTQKSVTFIDITPEELQKNPDL